MKKTMLVMSLSAMAVLSMVSCQQNDGPKTANTAVSPDSLMGLWNAAWNSHDSTALLNMFTEKASVVFTDKERLNNPDSIRVKWIRKNLPRMTNLKTENLSSSSSESFAYYSGNYTLDLTRNDSIVGKSPGNFTAIWKLTENNTWKIDLLFFGEHVE